MKYTLDSIFGEADTSVQDSVYGTEEQPNEYLSLEESSEATAQSKKVNGENGPDILTTQDLKDADDYEMNRILDENDAVSITENLEAAVEGRGNPKRMQQDALRSAWDRYLAGTLQIPGGLRLSDLRQYQTEAVDADNMISLFEDNYRKNVQDYQSKVDILYKIRQELLNRKESRSNLEGGFMRYYQAFRDSLPFFNSTMRSDFNPNSNFLDIFSPIKNTNEFNTFWHNNLMNPDISPLQFDTLVRAGIGVQEESLAGLTLEEGVRYIDSILALDTGAAAFELGVDTTIIGGMAVRGTVKAIKGAKHGLKGAALGAVKGAMPFLTPQGAKDIVKMKKTVVKTATEPSLNTVRKIGEEITEEVSRKKFVGDKKGAVQSVKKELGAPDVTNTVEDNKVVLNVVDNILGDVMTPEEKATISTVMEEPILLERQQRRLFRALYEEIQQTRGLVSVEGLEKALVSNEVIEKAFSDLIRPFPTDLVFTKKVGELIKAIPTEDLSQDQAGNLIARFRYPKDFATAENANNFATALNKGSLYDYEVVRNTDGTAGLMIDMRLNKGFGILLQESKKGGEGLKEWKGVIKSSVATITSTPDTIRELTAITDQEITALKGIGNSVKQAVKKLSSSEYDDLVYILSATIDPSKPGWYKPETLIAKGFSPKVVDTYSRIRAFSDLNFLVLNTSRRHEMAKAGVRSITINGKLEGYGKLIAPDDPKKAKDMLVTSNRYVQVYGQDTQPIRFTELAEQAEEAWRAEVTSDMTKRGMTAVQTRQMYEKAVKGLENGDYVLLEMTMSPDKKTAARNVYYIVPRNSIVTSDLPAIVMNYVPGWRRFFDRKAVYIKQARVKGGEVVGVNALFSGLSWEDALELNDAIEKIRKATAKNSYLKGQALVNADKDVTRLIQESNIPFAPFNDATTFKKWAASVGMDITNEKNILEVLKNDELPTAVRFGGFFKKDLIDKDVLAIYQKSGAFDALLNEQELQRLHRSGGNILDFHFNKQTTVDVDNTLSYMVDDMVKYGVMTRFEEVYSNRFYKDFESVLNKVPGFKNKRADQLLKTADLDTLWKNEKNPREKDLLSRALTAQNNYFVVRGYSTEADKLVAAAVEGSLRSLGVAADNLHIPKAMQHGTRVAYEAIAKLEPMRRLRQLTVFTYLRCCNTVQLVKNFIAPASYIIAAEAKHGAAAFKDVLPFFLRLGKLDKNSVAALAKLDNALELAPKRSNILFRNIVALDAKSHGVLGGFLENAENRGLASKISGWFFDTADTWNRIMALDTACRRFGYADRVIKDSKAAAEIISYADSLYINMGKRGLARIQQGSVARTLLQFQGFTMRTIETMLCDKQLSGKQRLAMGLTLLGGAGVGGILGQKTVRGLFNVLGLGSEEDDSDAVRVIKEAITIGFPDTVFKESGIDISMSGFWSPQILDGLTELADLSFTDIIAKTPATQVIGNYYDAVSWTLQFFYNKYGRDYSYLEYRDLLDVLLKTKKLPSGINNADLAYSLYRTGNRYNSRGQLLTDDNNKLQAVLTMLGFGSRKASEIYVSKARRQQMKDNYDAVYDDIQPLSNEAAKGNPLADLLFRYYVQNSDLTDIQKQAVTTRAFRGTVKAGLVPLAYQEWEESRKSSTKFGEITYKEQE